MKRAPRQQGAVLVAAVFLIVVLALLGAAMAMLSKVQSDTGLKTQLAANVYYGAKAGLDWGIQRAIARNICDSPPVFTLTQGALNGVRVRVACVSAPQGSATDLVFYITSTAITSATSVPGDVNYAERRLEATISNIP